MSADKLKHTLGPWKTPGHDIPNVHVYGSGRFPAIVAYCPALVNAGTTPDERVANAKLIAAAPELLDIAVTLENLIRNGAFIGSDDLRQLQDAIAKAKGEA